MLFRITLFKFLRHLQLSRTVWISMNNVVSKSYIVINLRIVRSFWKGCSQGNWCLRIICRFVAILDIRFNYFHEFIAKKTRFNLFPGIILFDEWQLNWFLDLHRRNSSSLTVMFLENSLSCNSSLYRILWNILKL